MPCRRASSAFEAASMALLGGRQEGPHGIVNEIQPQSGMPAAVPQSVQFRSASMDLFEHARAALSIGLGSRKYGRLAMIST